jgi:hypothetical protein
MFADVKVIGELPPRRVAAKLRQMGDNASADEINQQIAGKGGKAQLFGWGQPKPWQHATHQYGYIPFLPPGTSDPQAIQHAGTLAPDGTLKNGRINIHLDRVRVQAYPGGGEHHILLTLKAQNQLPNAPEPVSFSRTYRARDGQQVGVTGFPLFLDLNVGTLGVAFQGFTVNVKNTADEAFLGILDSAPFQGGLNLLTMAQPVLKPFTELTLGAAKMLAGRNKNVPVQDFYLGLDFTPAALGARLAEGNYFAVQVPTETSIKWPEWVFNPASGAVVSKADLNLSLPYNYVAFRVTRSEALPPGR